MKRLVCAACLFFTTASFVLGVDYTHFVSYRDNSIMRFGGGDEKSIHVTGSMMRQNTQIAPSPDGYLLWFELMREEVRREPYSQLANHLANLRQRDAEHLYDPDEIAVTLHICDQEGKDVATAPIPARHGYGTYTHAYFPTANIVMSFRLSRVAGILGRNTINIDTGEIFTVTSRTDHGLRVNESAAVSPDGKWVVHFLEFRGSNLMIVNGRLVAPVAMPLDWTVSPEQFDADLQAVEDALRERHRYHRFTWLRPTSRPFFPGDTRFMILEAKVGPIEEGKSFDDLKRSPWSEDDPDAPPPKPYDPELWEMNGLFVVDLEKLTTGDGEWTDAIVRELPGLGFSSPGRRPDAFFERTGGGPDLLCVDEQGRVYYIAEKPRLDDTPDRRWYFCDIEGNRLTPEGERVE